MLPQQTPFVGRHMTITATLIKIGGNCCAQHCIWGGALDSGAVPVCSGIGLPWHAFARRSLGRRLGVGERWPECACKRPGYRQCNYA